jgi:hypothetical protein
MTDNQIQNIDDFVEVFKNGFTATPTVPPTDVITLTGTYGNDPTTEARTWAIWRRDQQTDADRYPFLDPENRPFLMLYGSGQVGSKTYSSGIAFPINTKSLIRKITLNTQAKTITIEVNKNSKYWRYDRQNRAAIRKVFSSFRVADFTIRTTVTNPMDSQTPSHPTGGGGTVDPGGGG